MQRIEATLKEQDGVISRHQALECGLDDNDLRRLVRRNELRSVLPGVYVNHTGVLTWHQRAWAGVLYAWPGALSHQSALRAASGPGLRGADEEVVHVIVASRRKVLDQPGLTIHRLNDLSSRVQWNRSPPRLRLEEAVLDLAAEAVSEIEAIAVLAGVVSARQTTAARLSQALRLRTKITRRPFLAAVLEDVAAGTCSVLEHGYLNRVERPHGLPFATRQAIDLSRGTLYRDVLYEDFDQVVELDGRIFHTGARHRARDLARDLDAAVDGLHGVRLGWSQVFDTPCDTAVKIGAILRSRGWSGSPRPCAACRLSA